MADVYIDSQIQALREMHRATLEIGYARLTIREFLERQAHTLVKEHTAGNEAVTFHLACWYPPFIGIGAKDIMSAAVSLEIAKATIAKEYGYSDWAAVDNLSDAEFDIEFERCIDLVLAGNVDELFITLSNQPSLIKQTSPHPHKATLLHYLGANGVESHRQMTPMNAADVATCLINAGAAVSAVANIYGGSTALQLWSTSAHPRAAGVFREVQNLLDV